MSIIRPVTFPCPSCEKDTHAEVYESINADRRPDLRDALLAGTLFRTTCVHCQSGICIPPTLVYLHIQARLAVVVFPGADRADWTRSIAEAQRTLQVGFGLGPGKALVESLQMRVVFGWSALQEKLVLQQAGLEDVDVEILKLALLRTSETLPLDDALDLRLLGVADGMLRLAWVNVETAEPTEILQVPQDAMAAPTLRSPDWNALRAELSADPFVDLGRFLFA